MEDYSLSQIRSMQEEATRRVREMNRRSKQSINMTKERLNAPAPAPAPAQSPPRTEQRGGIKSFLNSLDIKKLIGENSEQAILLLLVIILLNDSNSDDYLIYALIYIML